MKDFRLSETQRKLVEEKHDVMMQYLDKRNLPAEEYYDVVVFGFLRAVQSYEKNGKSESLEALAETFMERVLEQYEHTQKVRKSKIQILSLDALLSGADQPTFEQVDVPHYRKPAKAYRISYRSDFQTACPMAAVI